ncbi:MAG: NAD(P)/FAD-dependent oxidoreductase [Clostridia bacterium]|nr:NAD(P)/FAD-dependent oxidoreductase [Clostridia bacterium]
MTRPNRVAIIGGGAAGMMAAGTALLNGAEVTVYEHKDRPLRKLAITGKGRCNLTNDSDLTELIANVVHNPRFLYTAFSAFSARDTMTLFESLGVPLKTERGKRVFPVSDKAHDVVNALRSYASGARLLITHAEEIVVRDGRVAGVKTALGEESYDAVVLATGGRSYPLTGSDGSGYGMARRLGHTVTPIKPSLVPLTSDSPFPPAMQGLSLKNVRLFIKDKLSGKTVYEDFGEMMFTHFGLTGPMVLSASAHLQDADFSRLTCDIDLKPALDEATLDNRILSDFKAGSNKNFENILGGLLPAKMIPVMLRYTEIPGDKKVHLITKEERKRLLSALKCFSLPLSGFRPIDEAIITSGGIATNEVAPKTMMSKRVAGLFFAGEILDVDAYTGGFNLQIAFSTGYLAGKSAAEYEYSEKE